MKVGIHVHYKGKVGPFSEKYSRILEENSIPYEILDINQLDFWERLKTCSHFIYHWGDYSDQYQIAHTILPIIEKHLNIKCFPDYNTYWHHDDKIREYYLLKNMGFPVIDSYVFWEKNEALNWLKNKAEYPFVFKLKSSAGSKDVVLVKNYFHARRIVNKMFGKGINLGKVPGNISIKIKDFTIEKFLDKKLKQLYRVMQRRDISYSWQKEKNAVFFQKYLPNNSFDTRVTIIGNRAYAYRRINRKGDFRSSGSGHFNVQPELINKKTLEIAFNISFKLNFQSMAYDFLMDEKNNYLISEISYTYVDWMLYECPGYWDNNLIFHDGHNWPQYFHLVDFLDLPKLIQPKFND